MIENPQSVEKPNSHLRLPKITFETWKTNKRQHFEIIVSTKQHFQIHQRKIIELEDFF